MNTGIQITFLSFLVLIQVQSFAQEISSYNAEKGVTFYKTIDLKDDGITRGVTVEEVADGGYVITGFTTKKQSGQDIFILKTDHVGEVIWEKTYGGQGQDNGWAVREMEDGSLVTVGYTDSFGSGGTDIFLMKTTASGDSLWMKTFGGQGDEYGWDVRITSQGEFIIASQSNSSDRNNIDAMLVLVDKDGSEIWSKTYGDFRTDRIFSVQQMNDGGYIATGITYSYESVGPNDRDGYCLKVNSSGDQEWYKVFGGDQYDVGHSVAKTHDGGIMITGYGESYNKFGNRDLYIIKMNNLGDIIWKSVQGSNLEERGIKGYQTSDGGYIAVGHTKEDFNVYLVRTNNQGDLLWTRNYGKADRFDFGYTVRETKDGGFIITGQSELFNGTEGDILLIKTDSQGRIK